MRLTTAFRKTLHSIRKFTGSGERTSFDFRWLLNSLSILNACSLFGRILPNIIAQRAGSLNVLIICCACSSLVIYLWVTAKSTAGVLVYNGFLGFLSGWFIQASL